MPRTREYAGGQQQLATNQLLEQVVQQLQVQTEELRQIRRYAAACDHKLSFVSKCMHQMVALGALAAQYSHTIAAAASSFMGSIAEAQHAAKLQLIISSGRLVLLVLLIVISACRGWRAVWASCTARAQSSAGPLSYVHNAVAARIAPLAKQWGQQRQQSCVYALLSSWSPNSGIAWCIASTTGWFMLGEAALTLWALHACSQRSIAAAAAAGKHAPSVPFSRVQLPACDPVLSMVLAVLPVQPSHINSAGAVLQAAVYEGLYGAVAVALVSGRWLVWLLLWELWLGCCYYNCTGLMQQQNKCKQRQPGTAGAAALQQLAAGTATGSSRSKLMHSAEGYAGVTSSTAALPATLQAAQQQQHCAGSWSGGQKLSALYLQLMLAAVQLLLPFIMAVVAGWH